MGFFSDLFGGGEDKATERAAELQQRAYRDLAPWRDIGREAIGQLRGTYISGDIPFEASPGYQFRLAEGERGINNMLAARGLLGSGRRLRELERYRSGLAAEEYDRGFNRMARLAGLGGSAIPASQQALTTQGQFGLQGAQARRSGYQDITNTLAGLAGFAFG